tara:strand:+ start:1708 stop:4104 length:2397 start_codon:yes stop_codon:yes gene_type:complete
MNKYIIMNLIKIIKPHFIVLLIFVAISFIYFSPLIEGKMLEMHDIKQWQGMSKEITDFRNETGEEALWTNSMFSGMPAYQIAARSNGNLIQYVVKVITFGMPRPANLLFLYLLGFYILLLSLKIDYRLSAIGAIAFAFSSYFFIIIQAGHMTKAQAIAYLPMVVAAVLYTYRGKMFLGGLLTALTVALQLYANHLQITYYLVLILLLIGLVQLIKDIQANNLVDFLKRTGVLILAALLASGTSFTRLATTMEYGKDSTRGKSELTDNIDNKTTGLDKDYATQWSYGITESFTLLIPNFYGGASQGSLSENSETYQAIKRSPNAKKLIKQLPLYWGDQPIVSGPTYAGSIVIFLFFLGLFFVKSKMRIWLIIATILSLMLAWGKNFMPLTDFFLDYFPGYNKFRAVSMILIIAEFTIPLLGFLALNKFLVSKHSELEKKKPLKLAFYLSGGLCIFFALFASLLFDFVGLQDINLEKNGWPIDALQSDRANLLKTDAWRSFIFITLTFSLLWLFIKNKIQSKYVILSIGVLILLDMWTVNKRYLNNDHFARKSKVEKPYNKTQADQEILRDTDPNYRVFNSSVSTFNDASTSYFHKSIGGYHGAKLKRYQELIERHISMGNQAVINMLNTRYIINRNGQVQKNSAALGNAWFVSKINLVENADEEINALSGFDPKSTAVIDKRFSDQIINVLDSNTGNINLLEYRPNYLKYNSESVNEGIAIFSEIYYDKGWNAYIDGEKKSHFRANYVLRGMKIPSGNHIVEFKFEPLTYKIGETISLTSSIILLLLLSFACYKELSSE